MDSYQENRQEEIEYLSKTLAFIIEEVEREENDLVPEFGDINFQALAAQGLQPSTTIV